MFTLVNEHFQYGKGGWLREQEKKLRVGEIIKVKIKSDKHLSPNITWAQKPSKNNDLQKAMIHASIETYVLKNSHLGFIKFFQQ